MTDIIIQGTDHAEGYVTRAANWLDHVWPEQKLGPWYDAVNVDTLNMASACLCVCGQLGAAVARHEGWQLGRDGEILRDNPTPQRNMAPDSVAGVFMYGYDLFVTDLDEWDPDTEDRQLSELLRKYLEVEGEDSTIPEGLEYAFVPLETASEVWAREILRRRRG